LVGETQLPFDVQGSGAGKAQLPFEVQGSGAGKLANGLGLLAAADMGAKMARFAVELNAADARPTKATSRANMRTAVFIFSNLSRQKFWKIFLPHLSQS